MARASWDLLKKDRELIWLPILGLVSAIIVGAAFFGPVIAMLGGEEGDAAMPASGWLLVFLGYLAVAVTFIFFQAAVICGAHQRMEGGDPTLGSALAGARRHGWAILGWAVIASTVSILLDAIEDRLGFVGALFSWLLDVAWRVTTFLVLPVIVVEGTGPIDGVKRSASLLRRTWGERVVADVGFGFLGFLLILPAVVLAAVLLGTGVTVFAVAVVAAAAVYVLAVSAALSALNGVFRVALHRYATDRPLPPEIDERLIAGTVRRR